MFVTFSQYMVMSLMNLSCTSIRGLDIPSMRGEQKSLHSEYKERGGGCLLYYPGHKSRPDHGETRTVFRVHSQFPKLV